MFIRKPINIIMTSLKIKCLTLIENPNISIRRNAGLFTPEEIEEINILTDWVEIDDFKERVFCIAYDITKNRKCPITKLEIRTFNNIRYHRMGKEKVLNHVISLNHKLGNIITSLYYDYDQEVVEKLFRNTAPNTSIRYPMFLNHCWVSLKNKGFDMSLIHSNEEAFHLHRENYDNIPLCDITGNKKKFNIHSMKYQTFHSIEASHIGASKNLKGLIPSQKTIDKRRETCLEKYGVSSAVKMKHVRDKGVEKRRHNRDIKKSLKALDTRTPQEKYKDTCIEKYGVDNAGKVLHIFKEKHGDWTENAKTVRNKTMLTKYGVDNPNKIIEVKNKIRETNIEKYGVTCPMNRPEIIKNSKLKGLIEAYKNFKRFKHLTIPNFSLEEWIQNPKAKLPWIRVSNNKTFYAYYTGYAPVGRFKNSSLEEIIHKQLNILNIKYEKNVREVIKNKELDIYIPSLKIAIECNGEYFHSTKFRHPNYHIEKKRDCTDNEIDLLHLWGRDIINKPKIIFGIIRNKIKKNRYKIMARKCKIEKISPQSARIFAEKYHLNGFSPAETHLGMFYKNRMVSYISLGKNRFSKNTTNQKEIVRYVNINNFYIIGGLEKFISYIQKELNIKNIITFSDNNLFNGNCYRRVGFKYIGLTPISYSYVKNNITYSRYQCQKHKLEKLLGDDYDPLLSEKDNMKKSGFFRIYDCGNHKFELKAE